MGDLTTAQYREEIQRHLANRTDLSDATYTRAINISQVQLARVHDFKELRTLVTPSIAYNNNNNDRFLSYSTILTSGTIHEVISFVASDGSSTHGKVTQISPRKLDKLVGDPTALFTRRIPSHYVIWNDKFELWPLPDKAYSSLIRLTKWPVSLSADTDVSDYVHKDDILIHLATSYLYHSLGEYERAARFFNMASSNIRTAVTEDAEDPDKQIMPAFNDVSEQIVGEYWNDPFIKGHTI